VARYNVARTWSSYTAAVLAFASAAVTAYWTAGGTLLLDTVGGTFEELGRARTATTVGLGVVVVTAKVAGGMLALALARQRRVPIGRRDIVRRFARFLGIAGGILLAGYGGLLVLVGGLVLTGVVTPSTPVNERALRWHVFVWDLWFLLWGLALLVAAGAPQRNRPAGPVRS